MEPLIRLQICTQSCLCLSRKSVCGHCREQFFVSEVVSFSTSLPIRCQIYLRKNNPSLYERKQDKIFHLQCIFQSLHSSSYFNCHTIFTVSVSLWKKGVHGFDNSCNGRVWTGLHISKIGRI